MLDNFSIYLLFLEGMFELDCHLGQLAWTEEVQTSESREQCFGSSHLMFLSFALHRAHGNRDKKGKGTLSRSVSGNMCRRQIPVSAANVLESSRLGLFLHMLVVFYDQVMHRGKGES